MMLYWIWLVGLMTVSLGLIVKGFRFVEKTFQVRTCDGPGYLLMAVVVAVIAIALTLPVHLLPLYDALTSVLPDRGSYIHDLTLWTIVLIASLGLVLAPLLITYRLHPKRLRTEMMNRLLSDTETTYKPRESANATE